MSCSAGDREALREGCVRGAASAIIAAPTTRCSTCSSPRRSARDRPLDDDDDDAPEGLPPETSGHCAQLVDLLSDMHYSPTTGGSGDDRPDRRGLRPLPIQPRPIHSSYQALKAMSPTTSRGRLFSGLLALGGDGRHRRGRDPKALAAQHRAVAQDGGVGPAPYRRAAGSRARADVRRSRLAGASGSPPGEQLPDAARGSAGPHWRPGWRRGGHGRGPARSICSRRCASRCPPAACRSTWC